MLTSDEIAIFNKRFDSLIEDCSPEIKSILEENRANYLEAVDRMKIQQEALERFTQKAIARYIVGSFKEVCSAEKEG
jgi:hypothetical protein